VHACRLGVRTPGSTWATGASNASGAGGRTAKRSAPTARGHTSPVTGTGVTTREPGASSSNSFTPKGSGDNGGGRRASSESHQGLGGSSTGLCSAWRAPSEHPWENNPQTGRLLRVESLNEGLSVRLDLVSDTVHLWGAKAARLLGRSRPLRSWFRVDPAARRRRTTAKRPLVSRVRRRPAQRPLREEGEHKPHIPRLLPPPRSEHADAGALQTRRGRAA
jgi:hypothetical protein